MINLKIIKKDCVDLYRVFLNGVNIGEFVKLKKKYVLFTNADYVYTSAELFGLSIKLDELNMREENNCEDN